MESSEPDNWKKYYYLENFMVKVTLPDSNCQFRSLEESH
jgi:hypothetical protein